MEENKKLPIFSKEESSEDFYTAFSHFGTSTAIDCICGRTHFCEEYPVEDSQDEQEISKLKSFAEKNPDAYIEHEGNNISYFHSKGKSVVFSCPCNFAGALEQTFNEHQNSILNYFDQTSKTELKSALAKRAKVTRTKEKVKNRKTN